MLFLSPSQTRVFSHGLAFLLVAIAPWSGWYAAARLRAAPSARLRLRAYWIAVATMIAGALAAFWLMPLSRFFNLPAQNREAGWLPSRELISVLAFLLVLMTALPILLASKSILFRVNLKQQFDQLGALLPQSRRERVWFAIAAACAAVCEEVLYRAFLLYYLHVTPWRLDVATSLAIACLAFGLLHLYQGFGALLQQVVLALGLGVLFLTSRSIVAPIVLHLMIGFGLVMVLPERQTKQ